MDNQNQSKRRDRYHITNNMYKLYVPKEKSRYAKFNDAYRERRTYVSNQFSIAALVTRFAIVSLAIGFLCVLLLKDYSFYDMMSNLSAENLAPFDITEFIREMHENLPDNIFVNAIEGLAILLSSLAYVMGFCVKLFWAVLLG